MGDKNWAHERWIDDICHRHDPSTPKHNKGRKRLRRAVKRREARLVMKQVDDLIPTAAEDAAYDDICSHDYWLDERSYETDYDDANVDKYKMAK